MIDKYLKKLRITREEGFIFLQLFAEGKTAVEIRKFMESHFDKKCNKNTINEFLNDIKSSFERCEFMSCNEFTLSKPKLIDKYKIRLRYKKNLPKEMQEVFWITTFKRKIYVEKLLIGSRHLTNLIRLLKKKKDQELNFNCHGLISVTKEGIKELYSSNDNVSNFIQTHKLRIKKHYGVNCTNRINYFYESVIRYNIPHNSMFEFLKCHLQQPENNTHYLKTDSLSHFLTKVTS